MKIASGPNSIEIKRDSDHILIRDAFFTERLSSNHCFFFEKTISQSNDFDFWFAVFMCGSWVRISLFLDDDLMIRGLLRDGAHGSSTN